MEVPIGKNHLKYINNYLDFQEEGCSHKGLKLNFQNFISEAGINELYGLNIKAISEVIYSNIQGKNVLDVFFKPISFFEKPWLRLTVDKELKAFGGPDCYIAYQNDEHCNPSYWTISLELPSDSLIELLSQKLPDIKRSSSSINLLEKRVLLRETNFQLLRSYPLDAGLRIQAIPLTELPYIIGQAEKITPEEIIKFNYKSPKITIPYPIDQTPSDPKSTNIKLK